MRSTEEHGFEQDLHCGIHCPRTPRSAPKSQQNIETTHENRVVCWTDGACSNNQFRHLRRAGCGVFFGAGHPSNMSYPLLGVEQTNQRAELHAVIAVLEIEKRPVEIRSDSKYVCDGFLAFQQNLRCEHLTGDNADLWAILASLVTSRDQGTVVLAKVKGHAKEEHVASGEVLAIDKYGNDQADIHAVEGSRRHTAPDHLVAAFVRRRRLAKATHSMMLRILSARKRMEAALGLSGHDEQEQEFEVPWTLDHDMFVPLPRSGEG